jgi:hypothetical protein
MPVLFHLSTVVPYTTIRENKCVGIPRSERSPVCAGFSPGRYRSPYIQPLRTQQPASVPLGPKSGKEKCTAFGCDIDHSITQPSVWRFKNLEAHWRSNHALYIYIYIYMCVCVCVCVCVLGMSVLGMLIGKPRFCCSLIRLHLIAYGLHAILDVVSVNLKKIQADAISSLSFVTSSFAHCSLHLLFSDGSV